MKQLELFWDSIQPFLGRLSGEEKKKITAAFSRIEGGVTRLEANYNLAIQDRAAVHALLKKTSDELIERYQIIFEHSGTVMVVLEDDGTISLANSYFEKIFGYTRREVEDKKRIEDLLEESCKGMVLDYHHRRRQGDPTVPNFYEAKAVTKEGKGLDIVISVEVFPGTKQSIVSIMDITNRKRAEEALQQANRKLNLLSDITRHDIRNQLLTLTAYLELSKESLGDAAKTSEYIIKEEQAVNAIERQIVFAKEYEDLGVYTPDWQNAEANVRKALRALPMRDILVSVELTDLEIYADPLFEKVFYNLIDNALRYGGSKMMTIRFTTQETEAGMVIICEDDGVGISAEDKKHLFERGFGHHTGFGLFLTREIQSITGITITETSEQSEGARFEITVPKECYRFVGTQEIINS